MASINSNNNYKCLINEVTEEKVKTLMSKAWNIEPSQITSDIELNSTHNWDSIGHVSLMLALEKEFNISINYETLTQLISFKKIVSFINNIEK